MSQKTIIFNETVDYRPGHRALTGFLRKYWTPDIMTCLQKILESCDVSGYVGALPPQLRDLVRPEEIQFVTRRFRKELTAFIQQNFNDICDSVKDRTYSLPQIGNLFETKCVLKVKGMGKNGFSPWEGASGFVCKLSFPEFCLDYAIKLFNKELMAEYSLQHGAFIEVATALAANHAEPRDNNPVYMACLRGKPYMLSLWTYEAIDLPMKRKNENEMFQTFFGEENPRNWRAGRRIDYGATYKTPYGMVSYPVRKLYRKITNAANKNDDLAMQKMQSDAVGYIARRQFNQALDCVCTMARISYDCDLYNFVSRYKIR